MKRVRLKMNCTPIGVYTEFGIDPLIRKNTSELSVHRQCELLHSNHATVYAPPSKPNEEKRLLREVMMAWLDCWHTTLPAMGSRKLTVKLQEESCPIGRKLVRCLMQEMGFWAIYPKGKLSKRNFQETIVPHLLRNKAIFCLNQVWSINITYIKLHRSPMYLTAIIDWYSRKIRSACCSRPWRECGGVGICLLYTSDAADE